MPVSRSGLPVVWSLVGITTSLFLISKPSLAFASPHQLLLTVSQLSALLGIILLSFTYFLSSRANFLENLFGGLDQVYRLHHLMGIVSFLLLTVHPLFLILNILPDIRLSAIYLFPTLSGIDYNLGIFALYTLITLISLTLFVRLPYHIWKSTHEYMGLVILLGFFHALLIESDISRFLPLRIWILTITGLGLLFHLYRRFLYDRFGPAYNYRISKISRLNNVTEIFLSASDQTLHHHPGQFVFVRFPGLPGLDEPHPFSISSAPQNPRLRLSIKRLGDFTNRIKDLTVGTPAILSGPYGQFYSRFASCDIAVCIAGGIGITPFISLLESKIRSADKPTFLFYSVKQINDAYYANRLVRLSKYNNINYLFHNTAIQGRINARGIIKKSAVNPTSATYFICGPLSLMLTLRNQLLDLGVRPSRIIFEDFNFK